MPLLQYNQKQSLKTVVNNICQKKSIVKKTNTPENLLPCTNYLTYIIKAKPEINLNLFFKINLRVVLYNEITTGGHRYGTGSFQKV